MRPTEVPAVPGCVGEDGLLDGNTVELLVQVGVGLGIQLGDLVLSSWMDIVVAPSTVAIVLGLGISTTVGLFFGVYPAMKAARLDPIAALSYE